MAAVKAQGLEKERIFLDRGPLQRAGPPRAVRSLDPVLEPRRLPSLHVPERGRSPQAPRLPPHRGKVRDEPAMGHLQDREVRHGEKMKRMPFRGLLMPWPPKKGGFFWSMLRR